MEKVLLNVGDVIYCKSHYGIQSRHTIDKVTPKRAFANHIQFEREVHSDNGRLLQYSRDTWSIDWYYLANEALNNEWDRLTMLKQISKTSWQNYPFEILTQVMQLITPKNNNQ